MERKMCDMKSLHLKYSPVRCQVRFTFISWQMEKAICTHHEELVKKQKEIKRKQMELNENYSSVSITGETITPNDMRVGDERWEAMLSGQSGKVDVEGVMMAEDSHGQLQPITKEFIESKFKAKLDVACDFKPIKLNDQEDGLTIDSQDFRSHAQNVLRTPQSTQNENKDQLPLQKDKAENDSSTMEETSERKLNEVDKDDELKDDDMDEDSSDDEED